VALLAITLYAESVLGVVTGTAGAAGFHLGHRNGLSARFEGEDLGMAISTFVHAKMELVTEFHFAAVVLESNGGGFKSLVAFVTVAGRREGSFIVVTSTAGLAIVHFSHSDMLGTGFKGKSLGVALFASEHGSVDRVPEKGWFDSLSFEGYVFRFHSHMAFAAVAGNGKGFGAVMAGAAGSTLFHLRHGHSPASAGNDFAIVAAFTLIAHFSVMNDMAENGIASSRNLINYIT
jgi:hypothetical protein